MCTGKSRGWGIVEYETPEEVCFHFLLQFTCHADAEFLLMPAHVCRCIPPMGCLQQRLQGSSHMLLAYPSHKCLTIGL